MEWSFLGAVGAFGAMFVALIALFQLQLNRLETRLRDEMRRNHQETRDLLLEHSHEDDGRPVFRLPQTAGD